MLVNILTRLNIMYLCILRNDNFQSNSRRLFLICQKQSFIGVLKNIFSNILQSLQQNIRGGVFLMKFEINLELY